MIIALWIIVALVALMFVFTGIVKLFGQPKSVFDRQVQSYFNNYGISRNQIRLIGLAELFGGISILFHSVSVIAFIGATILMAVTLGAIFFHLKFDTLQDAVPAIVMLVLSTIIFVFSYAVYWA